MIAPAGLIRAADLFCGAGGSSTGALAACRELGLTLDLTAVNHWPVAVSTHTANHGTATHFCEDLGAIDPLKAVPGGHLHLLVASPECTHHSNARGGKPMQDQSRASAWHITRWAAALRIDNVLIENVPEFQHWGPLGENGRPLKSRRGDTFRAFLHTLRSLNYRVEWRILNAADYGDATTRKRLFVIARRGNRKIQWPEPTHSPKGETDLLGTRPKWRSAREIIDWTVPGKSIFARKKPLSENTMRRIVAGLKRFGGPELEPFIVMLNGTTEQQMKASNRSIEQPLPTITAATHHYLAEPFILPNEGFYRGNQARSVDEPIPTVTANHGAGRVVQAFLIGQQTDAMPRPVSEPAPTVATKGAIALVEPFIIPQFSEHQPRSVDRPINTITTQSRGIGLCEVFVVGAGGAEYAGQPVSTEKPLGTVLTKDSRALVQPFIVPHFGERDGQAPRTHSVDCPAPAVTGQGAGSLVEPFLVTVPHGGGEERRTHSVHGPLPTQTGSNTFGLASAFIVQTDQTGGGSGCVRSVDNPLITVVSKQNAGVCEPHITKFYGTGIPASIEEPLDTITAKDRFGLVQPEIVTADGHTLRLDIHFRMLQPHELAAAMGFPADYHFTGNREERVKQIGNAVCVNLSKALIRTLLEDAR